MPADLLSNAFTDIGVVASVIMPTFNPYPMTSHYLRATAVTVMLLLVILVGPLRID